MSLLGIDVGTTGCKAVAFSTRGETLSRAYTEYDFAVPAPGQAELDADRAWNAVKEAVRRAVAGTKRDPVTALSICSLGEAVVPVSRDRRPLGPSLLGFDARGAGRLQGIEPFADRERFYRINGNPPGDSYGLTKLLWLRAERPRLYEAAYKLLPWASFIAYMLGAEPVVDYSLASRLLLFDLGRQDWSEELLSACGIDRSKLPRTATCGTVAGAVSRESSSEVGLRAGTPIVVGAHDQCASALGSAVTETGGAMFGMGTFPCIVPVFDRLQEPAAMLERGLNTEHHAVAGRYVTFVYNQGGSIIKWFRDTFAAADKARADAGGRDIYDELNAELPPGPGRVLVLPHFSVMGPPRFIADSCGAILGLDLSTPRSQILRGILEGIVFSLRESVDSLAGTEIRIGELRAVGGGSRSDAWVQAAADILGRPVVRLEVAEAGALGMAMNAGVAAGELGSIGQAALAMVREGARFDPDARRRLLYDERFAMFKALWPLAGDFLRALRGSNDRLRAFDPPEAQW